MEILRIAHNSANVQSRHIKDESRGDPLFTAATTTALSHRQHSLDPVPHIATTITIGANSLGAIDTSAQLAGHCARNHRLLSVAPQP